MIRRIMGSLLPLLLLLSSSTGHAQGAAPSGVVDLGADAPPYLGERPPGSNPRVFAPGVVSTGNIHSRLAISPDGREMYWNTVDMTSFTARILFVQIADGGWTEPRPPALAREGSTQSPMFAPDGKSLYFMVRAEKGWETRLVDRLSSGWGDPRSDGPRLACSSSFTRSGRVYFSSRMETKTWSSGIFSAALTPDGFSDPAPLDSVINVANAIDYTPYVAPDESFLLFSSNRPLVGDKEDMHIHVSFRSAGGTWSSPRRVSDIPARFPSLSPDGRYLFFCGDDGNIYWVDAGIIDALRSEKS